jgi:hypothetical protein
VPALYLRWGRGAVMTVPVRPNGIA